MMGLFLFSIVRLVRADWAIAAVDGVGFLCCSAIFWYVYQTGEIKAAGLLLTLLALGGTVTIVLIGGPEERYLLYPTAMAAYFLVAPLIALGITVVTVAIIVTLLLPAIPVFELSKFLLSIAGCILFAYIFASERNHQRDALMRLSTKDGLTGAGNRRAFDEMMTEVVTVYQRNPIDMVLVMIDLDNFKVINDKHGHSAGDEMLVKISASIQSRIRAGDHLFRFGGDEFVIISRGLDLAACHTLVEDLRTRVLKLDVDYPVSISMGMAEYSEGESVDEWLGRADNALLASKRAGRNRVSAA